MKIKFVIFIKLILFCSAYEQPAFKRALVYKRDRQVYLSNLPILSKDEVSPNVWEEYLLIRRRQLDELYFRN
jgi:hypothetical protein